MKTLALTLLSALTLSAGVAAAKPGPGPAPSRPIAVDHRGPIAPVVAYQPPVARPIAYQPPAARPQRVWTAIGTITANGRDDVLMLRGARAIDDLRLEVTSGTASVKQIVVTFGNRKSITIPVDQVLRAGDSKLIQLPGDARNVTRVQIDYGAQRQGMRGGRAAHLVLSAR